MQVGPRSKWTLGAAVSGMSAATAASTAAACQFEKVGTKPVTICRWPPVSLSVGLPQLCQLHRGSRRVRRGPQRVGWHTNYAAQRLCGLCQRHRRAAPQLSPAIATVWRRWQPSRVRPLQISRWHSVPRESGTALWETPLGRRPQFRGSKVLRLAACWACEPLPPWYVTDRTASGHAAAPSQRWHQHGHTRNRQVVSVACQQCRRAACFRRTPLRAEKVHDSDTPRVFPGAAAWLGASDSRWAASILIAGGLLRVSRRPTALRVLKYCAGVRLVTVTRSASSGTFRK